MLCGDILCTDMSHAHGGERMWAHAFKRVLSRCPRAEQSRAFYFPSKNMLFQNPSTGPSRCVAKRVMTHKALAAAVEQPSDVLLVGVLDRSHFFKLKNKRLPKGIRWGPRRGGSVCIFGFTFYL